MLPNLSKNFWEKQLIMVVLLIGASFTQALAQSYEYRAAKSGNWSASTTWEKRAVGTNTWVNLGITEKPSFSAETITITSGNTVYVNEATTVDQLVVENGATLSINYPVVLTVNDGSGTDLSVNGTVVANGRGGDGLGNFLKTVSTSAIAFNAGSIYKHEYLESTTNPGKTAWGIIPTATWDPASTVEITVAGATMINTSIPVSAMFNQNFGNVKWNTPNLTANISLMHELANIQGSFEVISTGTGTLNLNNQDNHFYALNIGKDFKILNNSKVVFAVSNPSSTPGDFYLNIGRSFEVSSTGTFTHNRTSYPVKVAFTGTDGSISASTTTGNPLRNMEFEVAYGASVTLANPFVVASPATLEVYGTLNTDIHNIAGGGNFNLNGGSSFGIGSPSGLNGNLSSSLGNIFLSPSATFIYNGTYAQATGSSLPSTVGNLVIDNAANLVELTSNLIVTNSLNLNRGVLSTNGKTLTLVESPSLSVVQNVANNSFVDGTVRYEAGTAGNKTLVYPIGKNNVARPITLTLTQGTGTNTYTASQTESGLSITNYPGEIESVSSKRFYTINKGGGASVSNAFVSLTFNADEIVSNTEMRIIKSNSNGTWSDLGGTTNGNTVTSTNPFTTFSQFAVAYKNITPLPVELVSFKAEKAENAVKVTWSTASEKNNAYFVIERSADGKNFTAAGQVEGNGTTSAAKNYAFLDKNPLNNVSYYRLKQVDLDGAFEYSQIVKVMFSNKNTGLSLNAFPNPTTDNVNVQVSGLNSAATLQVIDLTGRVLGEQQIVNDAKVNLAAYPAGIYYIKLVSENGTSSLKVIKN